MQPHVHKIIQQGDESGNGMLVCFRLPSGIEIFGMPTKNFYGGEWDLGPTWNYAVMADEPFLVDSGRFGQGKKLAAMMDAVGIAPQDLGFVLVSHGHEDHDGGLAELVQVTDLRVKAHAVWDLIIRQYPDQAPPGHKEHFPAKCWHCPMPASFYEKNCLEYHKVLQNLAVETIGDGRQELASGIFTYHLPGHSPDCLAVRIGDEAILVGDIMLPDITPWPTSEMLYDEIRGVIGHVYRDARELFGLQRYIRSLHELRGIAAQHPGMAVFPAHRLYYQDRWNGFEFGRRVDELLQHHMDRCGAILDIIDTEPKTAEEITRAYFPEHLLQGNGMLMAVNEVISHCEFMGHCGDVNLLEHHTYVATGSSRFGGEINRK